MEDKPLEYQIAQVYDLCCEGLIKCDPNLENEKDY